MYSAKSKITEDVPEKPATNSSLEELMFATDEPKDETAVKQKRRIVRLKPIEV